MFYEQMFRTGQVTPTIDDEFSPFVEEFEERWGHQLTSVSIQFTPFLGTTQSEETGTDVFRLALCQKELVPGLILVARDRWVKLTPVQKRIIILHEIGHCVFWSEHDSNLVTKDFNYTKLKVYKDTGCATSIMHPLMNEVCWYGNEEYYWSEFMARAPY
jgi:hypothetical protein